MGVLRPIALMDSALELPSPTAHIQSETSDESKTEFYLGQDIVDEGSH